MASVAGTLIRGDTRPDVPKWINVDPTQEQRLAIAGNLGNFDAAAKLSSKINAEELAHHLASLEKLMPGWGALNQTISNNLASQARGELPVDVQNLVSRTSAELGIATGTSGSDFDKYRQARNLGLTSLEMTDKALNSAAKWFQTATAGAPKFNFQNMFITPMERIGVTFQNRTMKWNRDWLDNQIDAMPNQYEEAAAGFFDTIEETGRSFLTSWGSAQAGGGGAAK